MVCAYAGRVADAVVAEVVVAEVLQRRLRFRVSGRLLWERDGDGYVVAAAASGDLLHKIGRTATASGCCCCCCCSRQRQQWWCGGYCYYYCCRYAAKTGTPLLKVAVEYAIDRLPEAGNSRRA